MGTTPGRIDVAALYAALDAEREARGDLSWRQVARECGLSPSTFTRLANGLRPDVEAFAVLVRWLNQPADRFIRDDHTIAARQPDLMAELAPLLRARTDLSATDAEHLQQLFSAAVKQFRAERAER